MWWFGRGPARGQVPLSVRRAHVGRHWRGVSLAELRARWQREAAGPVEEWPTEQIPAYVEAAESS